MKRINELKRRIFDLNDAEKAELKSLMEKRNADPEHQAKLVVTIAETEAVVEAERKTAQEKVTREQKAEAELSHYVDSLRGENTYLGNEFGDVPTWAIPDGVELGTSEGRGNCRLCGNPLHLTNVSGMTGCCLGHFYDSCFERMSMRSVVQWLLEPGWDKSAAGIEWAILGRSK